MTETKVLTTPDFWDCDCKENYIHPKEITVCYKCHAEMVDQPDSHVNEVAAMFLDLRTNCVPTFSKPLEFLGLDYGRKGWWYRNQWPSVLNSAEVASTYGIDQAKIVAWETATKNKKKEKQMPEEKKEEAIGSWCVTLNGDDPRKFYSKEGLTEFINKKAAESPMLINELVIEEFSLGETLRCKSNEIEKILEDFRKIAEEHEGISIDTLADELNGFESILERYLVELAAKEGK